MLPRLRSEVRYRKPIVSYRVRTGHAAELACLVHAAGTGDTLTYCPQAANFAKALSTAARTMATLPH